MALGWCCEFANLQQPKNEMQQAAQIIGHLCARWFGSTDCTPSNILKVIGWCVFGDFVTHCVLNSFNDLV